MSLPSLTPVPASPRASSVAAIVLAGGRGSRLGQSKPLADIGGEPLLRRPLTAVARFPAVVVGPDELAATVGEWPRATLTREIPAFGGPVAGIAAGLDRLRTFAPSADWVLVLACDLPRAPEAVETLLESVPVLTAAESGACLMVDSRPQWLCGVYRASALRAAAETQRSSGGLDAAAVRTLLGPLTLRPIEGHSDEAFDIDTPDDLRKAHERTPDDERPR
ncbi:molybdenum cofactor guanylyltransferase [Leifsonia sp. NPDC058292]|uniref:molybdenum cofactor guanylyltransferase n=1 Tax=Leifsonia sp. NPDC058292 TaxID=3346428 RepID=UPI0036D765BF